MTTQQTPKPCPSCHGARGRVETSTGSNGAQIQVWVDCSDCKGSGTAR